MKTFTFKHNILPCLFVLTASLFLLTGCNPHNLKYIEGTVTLDGQPIEGVSVTFMPVSNDSGLSAGGYTNAEGKFKISSQFGKGGDGTKAGKYNITFTKLAPERELTEAEKKKIDENPESVPVIKMVDVIPAKYNNPNTSGITAEVVDSGSNVFNFELKSK